MDMKRIVKAVNQGREYIFHIPTKSIELLNGLTAFFFAIVFMVNGATLSEHKFYLNFKYAGPSWIWIIVLILSIIQLNAMRKETLESNILSAIVLKVSALFWFMAALMFGSDYPPLSTGFFTYSILSFITVLAGYEISAQNTKQLLKRAECRNG